MKNLLVLVLFILLGLTVQAQSCPEWPKGPTSTRITSKYFSDLDTTFVQLSFTQGKVPIPVYCDEYSLKYSAGRFGGEVKGPVEKTTSIYSFWVPPIKSITVVVYQLYCKETGKAVKSGSIILNPPKKL